MKWGACTLKKLDLKKNNMRIAFAGSRNLAIEIIEWIFENKDHYNVQLVGGIAPSFKGWWDDKVSELYEKLEIPIYTGLEEMIDHAKPDLLFSLNYWKKISPVCISKVGKGIINIHHSYRLRFRGRYSTSWAIIHARKDKNWFHGTTLHYIDSELDNGFIIASEKCEIKNNDTAETLFAKVENLAIQMFKDNFNKMIKGVNNFIEPDETYFFYDKNSNKSLRINYGAPIEEVYDFVRAWTFNGRPKPYFLFNGEKIFLEYDVENS